MACEDVQIKYLGDGQQVLYTFPFEYMEDTDVWVGIWNNTSARWEVVHYWPDLTTQPTVIAPYYWTFDNATTVRFLQVETGEYPIQHLRIGLHLLLTLLLMRSLELTSSSNGEQ